MKNTDAFAVPSSSFSTTLPAVALYATFLPSRVMACRVVESFSSGGFFSAPAGAAAAAGVDIAAEPCARAGPGAAARSKHSADRPQSVEIGRKDRFDMAVSSAGMAWPRYAHSLGWWPSLCLRPVGREVAIESTAPGTPAPGYDHHDRLRATTTGFERLRPAMTGRDRLRGETPHARPRAQRASRRILHASGRPGGGTRPRPPPLPGRHLGRRGGRRRGRRRRPGPQRPSG